MVVLTCTCGCCNKLCSKIMVFGSVAEPMHWCHYRIVSVFNAVPSDGPEVTDIQYWFSALYFAYINFYRFTESLNNIMAVDNEICKFFTEVWPPSLLKQNSLEALSILNHVTNLLLLNLINFAMFPQEIHFRISQLFQSFVATVSAGIFF